MLAAAGYSAPPKTWDEFRAMAIKMTDPSKGVYGAGIGLGATISDAEWLIQVMLWGLGGSRSSRGQQDDRRQQRYKRRGPGFHLIHIPQGQIHPPAAVNWDDAGNNKAYLSGQAAMVINAGTLLAALKKDNPELYAKPASPRSRGGRRASSRRARALISASSTPPRIPSSPKT